MKYVIVREIFTIELSLLHSTFKGILSRLFYQQNAIFQKRYFSNCFLQILNLFPQLNYKQ